MSIWCSWKCPSCGGYVFSLAQSGNSFRIICMNCSRKMFLQTSNAKQKNSLWND